MTPGFDYVMDDNVHETAPALKKKKIKLFFNMYRYCLKHDHILGIKFGSEVAAD